MPIRGGVPAGAAIAGAGYAACLLGDWGGRSESSHAADDLGLVGAALAAGCAALAAHGTHGRERATWTGMAIGAAGWAAGEALWSNHDLAAELSPFPSRADAGYAAFLLGVPCAASAARLRGGRGRRARGRPRD